MPSRSGRLAGCCLACVAVISSGRWAKADPDGTTTAAIANQPLGDDPPRPRLQKGDQGASVSFLQQLLDKDRVLRHATPIATDGDFGAETVTALEAFQQRHGLPVTGVADDATWLRLENLNVDNEAGPAAPAAVASQPSTSEGLTGALDNGISGNPHAAMPLTASELQTLSKIVQSEAGVCSEQGKIAVAAVVLNRVRAGFANGTVKGVISEPSQFTSYNSANYRGTPTQAAIDAAQAAADGQDPTHGATFYYNPYLVSPSWAKGMTVLARIGTSAVNTHVFLRP